MSFISLLAISVFLVLAVDEGLSILRLFVGLSFSFLRQLLLVRSSKNLDVNRCGEN